jgi:hypothetical protein
MAVTTVFKNNSTGEIVDADMEINAVNFAWADLVLHPELANGNTADFQNTLTHELGHVIGLAHNCYSSNDGMPRLTDNRGNLEIDCGGTDVPATVTDVTMYPVVSMYDTNRRTLSPDDEQASCDLYPSGQAACACFSSAGCSVAGQTPASSIRVWAVVLAGCLVLAFAAIARRRSRPPA